MRDIQDNCEKLLVHIKKCQTAMTLDGYTDAGIIGYFIKLPFKMVSKKHFTEIQRYTNQLQDYIQEKQIQIEIKNFEEYNNTSILYNAQQLSALGYKQYNHRMRYLDELTKQVTELIDLLKTT